MTLDNVFYTSMSELYMSYNDEADKPWFSCFFGKDCNSPFGAVEASDSVGTWADWPMGCVSVMVPYGTKLQLWDGDGNSTAGTATGNYAELHGQKLLNTQGLLECKNVSEFSNLNLQYETTAYHKYTRTQWGSIDNEPDYGTPKGTWK